MSKVISKYKALITDAKAEIAENNRRINALEKEIESIKAENSTLEAFTRSFEVIEVRHGKVNEKKKNNNDTSNIHYEWADPSNHKKGVRCGEVVKPLHIWAEKNGLNPNTVYKRISMGWNLTCSLSDLSRKCRMVVKH